MRSRKPLRLRLERETIAVLSREALLHVAGGTAGTLVITCDITTCEYSCNPCEVLSGACPWG